MATKVFHIELRVPGITDPKKHDAIKEGVRIKARELFGITMLVVGDDTKPSIACYSEDYITGQDQILMDVETEEGEKTDD